MSWHFLQGQEEASWVESSLDGAPSALSMPEHLTGDCGFGLWPTPRAGNPGSRKPGTGGKVLSEEVKKAEMWPTPSANDWKGSSQPGQRRGQLTDPAMGVIQAGGQLNPDWVEWLMGWPIGWTGLEPLVTGRFREWQRWHGEF